MDNKPKSNKVENTENPGTQPLTKEEIEKMKQKDNQPADKKVESDTVEVDRDDLSKIFERIESQGKTIDLLMQASDKERMAKARGRSTEPLIHTCRIRKYRDNGKLIIGWKLTKNYCEIINGKIVEDQETIVMFEDGEKKTISLLNFYRGTQEHEVAEIVSRESSYDEKERLLETLMVQLPDGRKLKIGSQFIN